MDIDSWVDQIIAAVQLGKFSKAAWVRVSPAKMDRTPVTARSSYLRDSIGRSYADRLLQKPRRPRNRLVLKRNQLVHSLHLRVETPT